MTRGASAPPDEGPRADPTASFLLGIAIVVHVALAVWVPATGRIPTGHDGLLGMQLGWMRFNQAVLTGEAVQWHPYHFHGAPLTPWYATAGLTSHAMLVLYPWLPASSYITWFAIETLADQLVFAAGMLLLCRRYFTRALPTAMVVGTALLSSFDTLQPAAFQVTSTLPLILYCLERFLDTSQWRHAAFAANLVCLSIVSAGPAYNVALVSLAAIVWAGTALAVDAGARMRLRAALENWPGAAGAAASAVASAAMTAGLLKTSHEGLVLQSPSRNGVWVDLDTFLSYGTPIEPALALGLSSLNGYIANLDLPLFLGVPFVSLLLLSSPWTHPRQAIMRAAPFWVLTAFCLAFALGTPIAKLAYLAWPPLWVFRHLFFALPIAKTGIILIVGFALEHWSPPERMRVAAVGILAALSTLAVSTVNTRLVFPRTMGPSPYYDASRAVAETFGCMGLIVACWFAAILVTRRHLSVRTMVGVHLLTLATYRAGWLTITTQPCTPLEQRAYRVHPLPYRADRLCDPPKQSDLHPDWGSRYGFPLLIYGLDCASFPYRIDFWSESMDELLRAHSGVGPTKELPESLRPPDGPGGPKLSLYFPDDGDVRAAAGIERPKLRAWDGATWVPTTAAAVSQLEPEQLVLQGDGPSRESQALTVPMDVVYFDPNRLVLDVDMPKDGFLSYADAWDPRWRATADGAPIPVYRANGAYKAVPVEGGAHRIAFEFGDRTFGLLAQAINVNCLLWLFTAGTWTAMQLRRRLG